MKRMLNLLTQFILSFFISIILTWGYFYFYDNNYNENETIYNTIVQNLIKLNYNGTIGGLNNYDSCLNTNKNKFGTNTNLLCKNIEKLNIQDITIDNLAGKITFIYKKRLYTKNDFMLVYYKNGRSNIEYLDFPFYTKKNGGWIYDKKINTNWLIIRPPYLKIFYFNINH